MSDGSKPGTVDAVPGSGIPDCDGGTAYLLCFEAPGLHVTGNRYARHFLGWTEGRPLDAVTRDLAGDGSPLVRAAIGAGLAVHLSRSWTCRGREFVERLKARGESPRICPSCSGELAWRRAR